MLSRPVIHISRFNCLVLLLAFLFVWCVAADYLCAVYFYLLSCLLFLSRWLMELLLLLFPPRASRLVLLVLDQDIAAFPLKKR